MANEVHQCVHCGEMLTTHVVAECVTPSAWRCVNETECTARLRDRSATCKACGWRYRPWLGGSDVCRDCAAKWVSLLLPIVPACLLVMM